MKQRQAEQFLVARGLDVSAIDVGRLVDPFEEEMAAGLKGDASSLAMIPSYVSTEGEVPKEEAVIVMDAGGTNLRVSLMSIGADGSCRLHERNQHAMPAVEQELSAEAFFEQMADYLRPVADKARRIGLCFSYNTEITPAGDGRLLKWSKQIKAPEVVGKLIGENILKKLDGESPKHELTLLNDTVATLLAAKPNAQAGPYSSLVGFILGTGTNTAYVEQNARITKLFDHNATGSMAINVESGEFNRVPRSEFDLHFDATTRDPGSYVFEKMISGAYMGGLGLQVLKSAAEAGLFSSNTATYFRSIDAITTTDLDNFTAEPDEPNDAFPHAAIGADDRELAAELLRPLFERAAKLTATNIAATVIKTGQGHDPNRPVAINIDGSTFYKTKTLDFPEWTACLIDEALKRRGIFHERLKIDDSPTLGAAVAGLMKRT